MTRLPAEVRRLQILDMLDGRDFVRVSDVSAAFGISDVTTRADLEILAADGLLERVHGGAMAVAARTRQEQPLEASLGERPDEKAAIGRYVAGLVTSGDTVFLDVGSTAVAVARALAKRMDLNDVVVITSGLTTAVGMEPAIPSLSVVVTGGTLRPLQHSLVDPLADSIFNRIQADVSVIGCNGVHPTAGITNLNIPEAEISARMVAGARRSIVAADGSKIGAVSIAKICGLESIDLIVTSASAPADYIDAIRDCNTLVEVAP